MTAISYREVLASARRMPLDDQVELAAELLRGLRSLLRTASNPVKDPALDPLPGLSLSELRTLADAVVAPGHQSVLYALLEANRTGTLAADQEARLDNLLAQADEVALLKARARYTLHLAGEATEPAP